MDFHRIKGICVFFALVRETEGCVRQSPKGAALVKKGMPNCMTIKVGMVSLGCAKNQVDAERMLARLQEKGYRLVSEAGMADVAIVNTCGFIEDAKKEAIEEILELAKLKQEGRIKALIVTGCLSERYREEVARELPEVDAVLGIGANARIAEVVADALQGKRTLLFPPKEELPLEGERVQTTPYYYTYLKIAEGCDNCCSYCAIPMIRGGYRSRGMEEIVAEAERFAKNGVKELNIVAQDTTRYGEDLYGSPALPALLKKLCRIEGIVWIRLLYCYPDRVTDELLETMAREEKILPYLDLPLQHCDAQVLRRMNRRGDSESLLELLKKIRARVPGVTLRTTVMVGFPGEGEEAFEALMRFVQEARFDRLGCFAYSAEEGTPAALFEEQVPEKVKARRQELVMEAQERIMEEKSEAQIGCTLPVMVEGYDRYAGSFFGRSPADAPEVDGKVFFTAKRRSIDAGEIVRVRVTDQMEGDLIGELESSSNVNGAPAVF